MQPDFRTNGLGQQLLCFRVLFVITVRRGSRRAKWDCRQGEGGLLLNHTVWQRFNTAILQYVFETQSFGMSAGTNVLNIVPVRRSFCGRTY